MGNEPMDIKVPQRFPPPGGTADSGYGTQISTGWDMGVPTHWGGAGNGGDGRDWGVYQPPPEHVCTIHCNLSYHVLVSSGEAEAGTMTIQEMVVAARSIYPRDKSGA